MSAAGEKVAKLAEQSAYIECRIAWAEDSASAGSKTTLPVMRAILATLNSHAQLEARHAETERQACLQAEALGNRIAALEAQVKALLKAAKTLADKYSRFIDDGGGCDHDVGICWCEDIRVVDAVYAAIATGAAK